jgi:type I restriction enzyme, R subunit
LFGDKNTKNVVLEKSHKEYMQGFTDLATGEARRLIRSSIDNRAKESLLVDLINQTNLDKMQGKASIIDAFFTYAQAEQQREAQEIIADEKLDEEAAKRSIAAFVEKFKGLGGKI